LQAQNNPGLPVLGPKYNCEDQSGRDLPSESKHLELSCVMSTGGTMSNERDSII
jgi:hypothetical protein